MTTPCTQSDRIMALEINSKNMAQDISEIKKDVKDISIKFDELIDKLDKKFAAKRTELAMKWFIAVICLAVIWAWLNIVIKQ